MPTKPIEQATGLSSKTQLLASEVQAFVEASLDPAPLVFSQRFTELLAAHAAVSHLIFGLFLLCLAGLLLLAYQFGFGG